MRFINRKQELARLDTVLPGGLAVVYGRRRIGKTRLLVEWVRKRRGVYLVADQSAAHVQRRYFASALGAVLPGFGDVEYPDWRSLLDRLASDAATAQFEGPVVIDELPYLVLASPEFPSVLQQWLDHGAARSHLCVAVAGSSQRMMQGLTLDPSAPLFGRARQLFEVRPLAPAHLVEAFSPKTAREIIELYTAWGGVPRYWELAVSEKADVKTRVTHLVLDPAGPLHQEPDRLLIEDIPPATETRPVLDAIGAGCHKVSEIAGRLGRPATSLARPLQRLQAMGIVERQIPFGESPRKSKRSLYKICDPFFRLWFRVVAPNRSQLAAGNQATRSSLLATQWDGLVSAAWEDLVRQELTSLSARTATGRLGPWGQASRWWRRAEPEWDIVAAATHRKVLLLGEVKLVARPASMTTLKKMARELANRQPPDIKGMADHEIVRALFVPAVSRAAPKRLDGVAIVTARDLGLAPARATRDRMTAG